jgi:Ca2+-binding RTX toxin-like protein
MDFPTAGGAHFSSFPTGPAPRTEREASPLHGRKFPMSRIRLLALLAACVAVLAFAGSAMAAGGGGSSGDDNLKGSGRADTMQMRGGDDVANGGAGDDRMFGGVGDDRLNGGVGDDRLNGGRGDDVLTDDRGTDRFSGGTGDDRINAQDRRGRGRHDARDIVDCGTCDDTVIADDDDIVRSNCEHVQRVADDNGVDPAGDDKGGARRGGGTDDPAGHR